MCQLHLSREPSASVNDCPVVGTLSDPTDETVNARDISDLKIFVFQTKLETIQSQIPLYEHAPVSQVSGLNAMATRSIPCFKLDRSTMSRESRPFEGMSNKGDRESYCQRTEDGGIGSWGCSPLRSTYILPPTLPKGTVQSMGFHVVICEARG